MSWGAIANAVSYLAKAGGVDGHILSCESSEPGCWIEGLYCSREYNFTVSSDDGTCQSLSSEPVLQETGKRLRTETHVTVVGEGVFCDCVSWGLPFLFFK